MSRLYGRQLSLARYSHQRQHRVTVLDAGRDVVLPPLTTGTVNYARDGVRRQASLNFVTQNPHPSFLDVLDQDQARWVIEAGLDRLWPLGTYYIRDYSIDHVGEYSQYRLYLHDQSALISSRKTLTMKKYSGDVLAVCRSCIVHSADTYST
jgi:hypothetical protein